MRSEAFPSFLFVSKEKKAVKDEKHAITIHSAHELKVTIDNQKSLQYCFFRITELCPCTSAVIDPTHEALRSSLHDFWQRKNARVVILNLDKCQNATSSHQIIRHSLAGLLQKILYQWKIASSGKRKEKLESHLSYSLLSLEKNEGVDMLSKKLIAHDPSQKINYDHYIPGVSERSMESQQGIDECLSHPLLTPFSLYRIILEEEMVGSEIDQKFKFQPTRLSSEEEKMKEAINPKSPLGIQRTTFTLLVHSPFSSPLPGISPTNHFLSTSPPLEPNSASPAAISSLTPCPGCPEPPFLTAPIGSGVNSSSTTSYEEWKKEFHYFGSLDYLPSSLRFPLHFANAVLFQSSLIHSLKKNSSGVKKFSHLTPTPLLFLSSSCSLSSEALSLFHHCHIPSTSFPPLKHKGGEATPLSHKNSLNAPSLSPLAQGGGSGTKIGLMKGGSNKKRRVVTRKSSLEDGFMSYFDPSLAILLLNQTNYLRLLLCLPHLSYKGLEEALGRNNEEWITKVITRKRHVYTMECLHNLRRNVLVSPLLVRKLIQERSNLLQILYDTSSLPFLPYECHPPRGADNPLDRPRQRMGKGSEPGDTSVWNEAEHWRGEKLHSGERQKLFLLLNNEFNKEVLDKTQFDYRGYLTRFNDGMTIVGKNQADKADKRVEGAEEEESRNDEEATILYPLDDSQRSMNIRRKVFFAKDYLVSVPFTRALQALEALVEGENSYRRRTPLESEEKIYSDQEHLVAAIRSGLPQLASSFLDSREWDIEDHLIDPQAPPRRTHPRKTPAEREQGDWRRKEGEDMESEQCNERQRRARMRKDVSNYIKDVEHMSYEDFEAFFAFLLSKKVQKETKDTTKDLQKRNRCVVCTLPLSQCKNLEHHLHPISIADRREKTRPLIVGNMMRAAEVEEQSSIKAPEPGMNSCELIVNTGAKREVLTVSEKGNEIDWQEGVPVTSRRDQDRREVKFSAHQDKNRARQRPFTSIGFRVQVRKAGGMASACTREEALVDFSSPMSRRSVRSSSPLIRLLSPSMIRSLSMKSESCLQRKHFLEKEALELNWSRPKDKEKKDSLRRSEGREGQGNKSRSPSPYSRPLSFYTEREPRDEHLPAEISKSSRTLHSGETAGGCSSQWRASQRDPCSQSLRLVGSFEEIHRVTAKEGSKSERVVGSSACRHKDRHWLDKNNEQSVFLPEQQGHHSNTPVPFRNAASPAGIGVSASPLCRLFSASSSAAPITTSVRRFVLTESKNEEERRNEKQKEVEEAYLKDKKKIAIERYRLQRLQERMRYLEKEEEKKTIEKETEKKAQQKFVNRGTMLKKKIAEHRKNQSNGKEGPKPVIQEAAKEISPERAVSRPGSVRNQSSSKERGWQIEFLTERLQQLGTLYDDGNADSGFEEEEARECNSVEGGVEEKRHVAKDFLLKESPRKRRSIRSALEGAQRIYCDRTHVRQVLDECRTRSKCLYERPKTAGSKVSDSPVTWGEKEYQQHLSSLTVERGNMAEWEKRWNDLTKKKAIAKQIEKTDKLQERAQYSFSPTSMRYNQRKLSQMLFSSSPSLKERFPVSCRNIPIPRR